MAQKMQPEIVSRETVKPFSSIPHNHPTIHNLSFFDQTAPPSYEHLLFFYSSTHGDHSDDQKSNLLKVSLSAALSHYYPLAGRIKGHVSVDCNDEGVLFLEARMECSLPRILMNPDDELLRLLVPDSLCNTVSPVAVQVTYFKCRGMSIGLCFSHTILDLESMSSFIKDWVSLARNSDREISPEFNIGALYPPLDPQILKQKPKAPLEMKDRVTRRLVFHGSKIAKLKAMVADQVSNPTRVEVVASLLYKSAISAAAKVSSSGSLKPWVMNHIMNIRTRISPPLSERNKGNLVMAFRVLVPNDRLDVELGWLVEEFRQSKTQLSNICADTSNSEELCSLKLKSKQLTLEYSNVEHRLYFCTSWCKNPFYESDFGWGKPLWVAKVHRTQKNVICLIDTREGDGIEAYICFDEKVMAVFENDQELLSFSVINPSISDLDP